ncbi:ABC transporter permease [Streptomyces radicis]|uniref:FtsX-like permease family protein n=1 Tax=Streptomyces radicis TaxID=1750517 RepID=A0A3A9WAE1_9ACTN|nr:ABC transporter permease [Streptomyces radicis]RKN10015.1 FtsX-like permease family protein [Streptomyces radicis]RKN24356.1 FtsX-like permease family protein [Streptomyces radicis]
MTVLKTSMRSFFAHKGRMLLSGVAIVLSVAFVCGTLVFTDTLNTTFDKFFGSTAADVTVGPEEEENAQETGRAASLPASLVDEVGAVEGVASADGVVFDAGVTVVDGAGDRVGSSNGAPTIATGWGPDIQRAMELASGRAPEAADEALIDADTAGRADIAVGDELEIIAVEGTHRVTVTGLAEFRSTNPGAPHVLLEAEAARTALLGSPDLITSVHVMAEDGVPDAEVRDRVAAALGGSYDIETAAENEAAMKDDVGGFLDVLRYAMLGFAGIAVLVGIFLIVNTFSMLVAQRTREIGLMRAVGASRRQVNRSVLTEALLLGTVGSLVGIGAGIGLAVALMELMNSVGITMSTSDLTIAASTPVAGLVVGVLATVVAAWLPARRAGKVAPMAALRDAGTPGDGAAGRVRTALGLLLTLGGGAALVAAAEADEAGDGSLFLSLGLLLTLVGAVVVGPLLASGVVRVLSVAVLRVFGPVGRMAGRNARRNPRRTGATAGALMIGLALVGSLSVVSASLVASASDQLDRSVGADFIIDTTSEQLITPEAAEAVRATPGLEHVTDYAAVSVELATPDGESSAEEVIAASPTYARDLRARTVAGELSAAYEEDHLSVGESFAEEHGLAVGDELTARFVGGDEGVRLTLAAITSENTMIDKGAMYVSHATARAHLPEEAMPLNLVMFARAEEGRKAAAYDALKASLEPFPQYEVSDQADYKQALEDEVGTLLNVVYALLALAIIVAVLGVVNTLALSVIERTREIGLMRAIGLSRRQMRRMVRLESVVIALFGAVLGLGLGLGWGVAAQRVLSLEGFAVLDVPWATLGVVFAGSAVVGLVAAIVPAFRAGRMSVLRAIATE